MVSVEDQLVNALVKIQVMEVEMKLLRKRMAAMRQKHVVAQHKRGRARAERASLKRHKEQSAAAMRAFMRKQVTALRKRSGLKASRTTSRLDLNLVDPYYIRHPTRDATPHLYIDPLDTAFIMSQ